MLFLKGRKRFDKITRENVLGIMKTVLNFYQNKLWWIHEVLKLLEVIISQHNWVFAKARIWRRPLSLEHCKLVQIAWWAIVFQLVIMNVSNIFCLFTRWQSISATVPIAGFRLYTFRVLNTRRSLFSSPIVFGFLRLII